VKWYTSTNGKYASNSVVILRNLLLRYVKCFRKPSLMIPCAGQRLLDGIQRSKFDKFQFRVWKFQVIYFDVGAGIKQKCSKSSIGLAGPITQYMLMHFKQRFKHGKLARKFVLC
jgi:hypothetical protein